MKTALEENNSYIGSHIDDCYQCVAKFSRMNQEDYEEFEDGDNHTRKDSEHYATSYLDQNGIRIPELMYLLIIKPNLVI